METENDPNFAYYSSELSDDELAEFERTRKLKYIRAGGTYEPGEYIQYSTKDKSKLRGRVVSSRKIDDSNTEIEVEYVGE